MNACSKHSYEAEAQELKKFLFMEDIFYSHCLKYIYKKAGLHCCCSASQGPGIAFHLNKQHRSPRRYVQLRTHLFCGVHGYGYTYPRGHQNAAMSWVI